MAEVKSRVGRPSGDTQNRDKLILAARSLFIERDYAQVTIREIAGLAGTDPGLIRYYFGSKESLFSTMIRETALPVVAQLYKAKQEVRQDSPAALMSTYYSVMSKHPHFPRLMFRIAGLDQSLPENAEVTKAFYEVVNFENIAIFQRLKEKGLLREDVDAHCAQLSFFAMMVFPFLVPENLLQRVGIEITPTFLQRLAEQNARLLQRGLMEEKDESDE
ncbi:TetR/AcrR family transcriptional regulator [Shewanella insulae]|uniref:TetR family transcriptional regulator n=1 Tax=Shewanella insulae TaxID=2681496 RepID=A0A6L7I265_9GAMM|nr:TetR/AcrR family transcriptional regulator [Shewanella insulae]MCG9712552.1 TetR/AcrR family transcriptional regulator [Shewanella insulae]MCG9738843.1 TetR/AcrR family transcriptional regulator [Shewanella insulae]MCG9754523.1 TetR/AcrR family transcriptional regulator [Shewanella insulae]MXR70034.1 TetR family transcriptional regulator [Shewanella insulae]